MKNQRMHAQSQAIARVCEYIAQNLDDELTLDQLSRVAVCSRYHFHRMFSAHTGITVARFVQLARLKRASYRLAFERHRIIDVALEAGFETPEAFARAFRRNFDQSPSEFRQQPRWEQWHQRFAFEIPEPGESTMQVEIVVFPRTKVAVLEHHGSPQRVLKTVRRFIEWRKETGLSPIDSSKTFGIPHGDPNQTEPSKFRWDVCGSVESDVPDNAYGVRTGEIPGGRCARVTHRGSHDLLDRTIYPVYRDWLPASGEVPADRPCFFHYLNFVHQVDECDLETDVYIPLVG